MASPRDEKKKDVTSKSRQDSLGRFERFLLEKFDVVELIKDCRRDSSSSSSSSSEKGLETGALSEVGLALMDLYQAHQRGDLQIDMLKRSLTHCISHTEQEELLWRDTSCTCTWLSEYIRKEGEPCLVSLRSLVGDFLSSVERPAADFEVNPDNVSSAEELVANRKNLVSLCQSFLTSIISSRWLFPVEVRELCRHAFNEAEKRFPGSGNKILGSILFLRFYCPAIVSDASIRSDLYRSKGELLKKKQVLVTVAKILQRLVNEVISFPPDSHLHFMTDDFMIPSGEIVSDFFKAFSTSSPKSSFYRSHTDPSITSVATYDSSSSSSSSASSSSSHSSSEQKHDKTKTVAVDIKQQQYHKKRNRVLNKPTKASSHGSLSRRASTSPTHQHSPPHLSFSSSKVKQKLANALPLTTLLTSASASSSSSPSASSVQANDQQLLRIYQHLRLHIKKLEDMNSIFGDLLLGVVERLADVAPFLDAEKQLPQQTQKEEDANATKEEENDGRSPSSSTSISPRSAAGLLRRYITPNRVRSLSSPSLADSPSEWSVTQVHQWLISIKKEDYWPKFKKHHVDGNKLLQLNDRNKLKEMGIHSLGDRKEVLHQIELLRTCALDSASRPPSWIDKPPNEWTLQETCEWLSCIEELGQYKELFLMHGISGPRLCAQTMETLLDTGIIPLGHRKRLLRHLQQMHLPVASRDFLSKPVSRWDKLEMATWLARMELFEEYYSLFCVEDLKGDVLLYVTNKDLLEVGITNEEHRATLRREIHLLRKRNSSESAVMPSSSSSSLSSSSDSSSTSTARTSRGNSLSTEDAFFQDAFSP